MTELRVNIAKLEPRLVDVKSAAAYVGISASKLLNLVHEGRAPNPRRIDRRRLWDRHDLDQFIDELDYEGHNSGARDATWDD